MRPLLLVLVAGAAGLVLAQLAALPQQQEYTVQLDITCPASGAATVTVNPWRAELGQGQDIGWELRSQAQSDSFAVEPKRQGPQYWPYPDTGRHNGTKTDRAPYRGMKPGQQGRAFKYNIVVWCVRQGRVDTVVVDPDIVIR
jgi:hypothetical protein